MELIMKDMEKRLYKELPERVDISESETIIVKNQTAILAEWDGKFSVGYKADTIRRVVEEHNNGNSLKVTQTFESFGEYKYIPKESTLGDIVETINELVDIVSSQMLGEAE